ncbi:MAG: hypothetical protein Edafosvirus33_4 [Edafosvirus sp.]|uniref:Sel1 repeat family protein n=1 Tax=Edafosvirus sp. TaxID=2487765 RepID=A0A3G4ZWQ5_9VIRU|nr:MAG: hypothetical protein Edafosvirus33_4 [Edafosvirus sp.]
MLLKLITLNIMGTTIGYIRQDTLDLASIQQQLEQDKMNYKIAFQICNYHIKKYKCPQATYLKGLMHSGYYCGHINWDKAKKLFESVEKNYAPAMRELALMYYYGKQEWLKSRKPIGIINNEQLGLLQTKVKITLANSHNVTEGRDHKKSFELLNNAIKLIPDDGVALLYLGKLLEFGTGVEQNYKLAMERYKESLQVGEKIALDFICSMYIGGKGFELDNNDATRWFTMAEATSRNFSKLNMAKFYEARKDYDMAFKYCSEYIAETHDNQYEKMLSDLTVKNKVAEPIDYKVAEPIDHKVVEPVDHKVAEPVDHKVAEPVDHKVVESVDNKAIEPVEHKVAEPVV